MKKIFILIGVFNTLLLLKAQNKTDIPVYLDDKVTTKKWNTEE